MLRRNSRPPVDYSKCNQTATIYHNVNGTITKRVLSNVFFDFRKNENVNKTGIQETNSCLVVIPNQNIDQPIFNGDKIVLGVGADITTAKQWAELIPSKVSNMCIIKYVDPKYWNGNIAHWEGGG